jgi:hypothetical protein
MFFQTMTYPHRRKNRLRERNGRDFCLAHGEGSTEIFWGKLSLSSPCSDAELSLRGIAMD